MIDRHARGIIVMLLTAALVVSSTFIASDQWNAGRKEPTVSYQAEDLLAYLQFSPGYPPAGGGYKPYYPPGVQPAPRGLPYIVATPVPAPSLIPAFPGRVNPLIVPG